MSDLSAPSSAVQIAADLRSVDPERREAAVRKVYDDSIRMYGSEHTHDFSCRTWRGSNWFGACDCTLRAAEAQS